jgi:hypothetical protein
VQTGITEDVFIRKPKLLSCYPRLFRRPISVAVRIEGRKVPPGKGLGLSRWAGITKQKIVVSYNILAQLSPLEGHPSVLDYRAFQKIATIVG